AWVLGVRKGDLRVCYRAASVSAGTLGLRLTSTNGDTVLLATSPSDSVIAAEACSRTHTVRGSSTGVVRLATRDYLIFPVMLDGIQYVGAISGAMLNKPEIMKRKGAFEKRDKYSTISPLSTT